VDVTRVNAHGSFRFWVEISGLLVGGFSEVSGLQAETELHEFAEGGVNEYIHRFPKRKKYPPIALKRGLTSSNELWDWFQESNTGKINRKSGSIIMEDLKKTELCRWNFFEAYPVKWIGPDFNSSKSSVAIETLEIVHNGLKAIFKKNT